MKFIIVRFDGDRLEYYGPFYTRETAASYAKSRWKDSNTCSYVIKLTSPK